ncbi:TIGR02281 family clan AA aspartic protease [Sungkyunkwania multivorans]|uniref:TIGR02281 family clan AA aspartic protease n=1 Tax=Sungkyunkwania multivorans TaxID=1173618 RepID=A0ABW3CWA1_9FLAO
MIAEINDIKGRFILDTGASGTCVGIGAAKKFGLHLNAKDSTIKAAGAGGVGLETMIAKGNSIHIGTWKRKRFDIILFDMIHVNTALVEHNATPVDGIIGADILRKAKAVIDYDKSCLYLKR